MAFNLSSPNYLDPRSGMPGNKPMQFLVGGTMGGNSQGFLGSTQPATTSATTTPKLDLLKVEKSPELNQTLKNLTADLDKLRTEQNTAADAFAKLNSELFNPDFLGRERAKFDLVPITNQLAANTNQYRTAVNEGLGLALDRANRNADLSRLGQTAGGGGLGDSSYNRLLQGQMFREAATPFLGAVADRERADAMWLEQLKQAQVGRDLALTQAYLNQQAMPAQLRAQLAAQQAGLLGDYSNLFNNLNFLGVGGQNPMSSPFIGASPNVPYFPAPSPARRGTGSFDNTPTDIPLGGRRPPPGVTTNTSPSGGINDVGMTRQSFRGQEAAAAAYKAQTGVWPWEDPTYNPGLMVNLMQEFPTAPSGYNRPLVNNPNWKPLWSEEMVLDANGNWRRYGEGEFGTPNTIQTNPNAWTGYEEPYNFSPLPYPAPDLNITNPDTTMIWPENYPVTYPGYDE